ncbi:MAG: MFS transporter [Xanthobacteraceae bacterium]
MAKSTMAFGLRAQSVQSDAASIETSKSWIVATAVLFILTFAYGAPLVAAVALKEIAADMGDTRSVPALAGSLVWLGSGLGAIGFGRISEQIGFKWMTTFGALMIGAGLALSAIGGASHLIIGHALFVGVLGSGAINVPLMIYVSRWFDRRRGSALAFVTSGQYIAGTIWPFIIVFGVQHAGWRTTMMAIGVATAVAIAPISLIWLAPVPEQKAALSGALAGRRSAPVLRFSPSVPFALLCIAGFLCCVPMAMPSGHLVALCSDLGIRPAQGALMLSVMLGSAFLSRQLWGWLADRVGGLRAILGGSVCQALALSGFLWTQDEAGLFAVSAAFGFGFSGIIPAYIVALREMFPVEEASWRVPLWFFINLCGMALGGWLAGFIYDHMASYAPAFTAGIAFNIANIALIGWMVARQQMESPH